MDTSYQTLVLNRLWQAVNVVGVERAFCLLALDHAQVIFAEDGSFRMFDGESWFAHCREMEHEPGARVVRTVSQKVIVPSVLLLRNYDRMLMQEMKFNRQNLLERDEYKCQYCGKNFPPKDLNVTAGEARLGRTSSFHASDATVRRVIVCLRKPACVCSSNRRGPPVDPS